MSLELLKKELEYISHKVYERRMVATTGGNISVRIPGTDHILIKKSGVSLGEVSREDALVVNMEGEVVEGYGTPSKETGFHLGIYKVRPDVQAINHCHPPYAVAWANLGMEIPLLTVTAQKNIGKTPVAKAGWPGSSSLRENVIKVFEENPGIKVALLEKHGICAVGKDLEAAYNIADLAEQTALESFVSLMIKANENLIKSLTWDPDSLQ